MAKDSVSLPAAIAPPAYRRWIWWFLVAITLVVGYADLWRGGETVAPVLLVLAYCVFVPVAILKR